MKLDMPVYSANCQMCDFIFMKLFESIILNSPTCFIVILFSSSNWHFTSLVSFKWTIPIVLGTITNDR